MFAEISLAHKIHSKPHDDCGENSTYGAYSPCRLRCDNYNDPPRGVLHLLYQDVCAMKVIYLQIRVLIPYDALNRKIAQSELSDTGIRIKKQETQVYFVSAYFIS
ncbi:hypothetical protein TNCT_711801 [Trichonephila clavata]|uniref:Uncharacterized protein n=1 Tax=Trichonephila clavata TaxID=2740835 RepID=A0A8X6FX37_TRICU|nr:hypothetical protein TNCT_711801 [Trichonephila clavata]